MAHRDPEEYLAAHAAVMGASLCEEVRMVLETLHARLAVVHARGSFRVVAASPVIARIYFDTPGDHREQRDALREATEALGRAGFDAGFCSLDRCVTASTREEQQRMDEAA